MGDFNNRLDKHLRAEHAKRILKIAIIPVIALGILFAFVVDRGSSDDAERLRGTITGFRSASSYDGTDHFITI